MGAFEGSIEVVRGRLSKERAEQLLRFWARHRVLERDAARRRLDEVVCVLLGDQGEIAGVNSVYPANVEFVGGLRLWVYRRFLVPAATEAAPEMIRAAFRALDAEFDPDGDGPIGLCVLLDDREEMARNAEAEWRDPRMVYAGYLADGRQVRVGYFQDARIYDSPERD